jgi:hypothetical protein
MENPPRLKIFLGGWSLYELWFCGSQSVGCNAKQYTSISFPWKAKQAMLDLGIDRSMEWKLLDVSFGNGCV